MARRSGRGGGGEGEKPAGDGGGAPRGGAPRPEGPSRGERRRGGRGRESGSAGPGGRGRESGSAGPDGRRRGRGEGDRPEAPAEARPVEREAPRPAPVREPEPPIELPADLEAIMRPIDVTTRSFLAIEAGRAVEEEAVRQQGQLAALGADCVPRAYLHVTLEDLGEVPPEALEAVLLACERVLDRQPPFTLRVAGICAFPTPAQPRIVGLNVLDPRGRLAALRAELHAALVAYGFQLDERRFWPHVALARLPADAGPLEGARFTANEVSLRVRAVQVIERAEPDVVGPPWRVRGSIELKSEPTRAENRVDAEAERAALGALLDARLSEQQEEEPLVARAGRRGRGRRRDERPRSAKP